jgi:hypothetical protein
MRNGSFRVQIHRRAAGGRLQVAGNDQNRSFGAHRQNAAEQNDETEANCTTVDGDMYK